MAEAKKESVNKFVKALTMSNKDIKQTRAKIIAETAESVQSDIVRDLEKRYRSQQLQLVELTDVSPESELSLRVTKKDFDAGKLFKDIHETKLQLAETKIELDIANETYEEWFK